MMGQKTDSAAPAYAIKIWVDPRNIYFELRGINGPAIVAFPRSSAGFASAIATLFAIPEAGEPYSRPQVTASIPDKNGITGIQRSEARDILKRLKII